MPMPTTTMTASHTSQLPREGFVVLGRARSEVAGLTGGDGVETASCSSVSGDWVGVLGLSGICFGELFHFLLSELGPQRQGLRPRLTSNLDAGSTADVSHRSVGAGFAIRRAAFPTGMAALRWRWLPLVSVAFLVASLVGFLVVVFLKLSFPT